MRAKARRHCACRGVLPGQSREKRPSDGDKEISIGRRCRRHPYRSGAARRRRRLARRREGCDDAEKSGARHHARHRQFCRARRRSLRHRILRPRHDDHHQRAAGNARRQGRPAHHPRLSRRPGDAGPGARRQPVRLFLPEAAADRAAEPDPRDRRPHRLRGRRARAARRGRGAPRRGGAESGRRRLDRGLLSLLLHESRARGAHRRADPRGISRGARFAVVARCCRASANGRGCRRRCSTPISRRCWSPTSPISKRASTRAGVDHAAALPDAVERRRDAVRRRGHRRQDRAYPVLRPGRRRAGERLSAARRRRQPRPRHARHGRHQSATSPSSKAARRSK